MPSLQKEVLNSYSFSTSKHNILEEVSPHIHDDDYLKIFALTFTDPDRKKTALAKLCYDCLMKHLENKPLDQAIQQINHELKNIFKNHLGDADVQQLIRDLDDFIYQLPRKSLYSSQSIQRKS